MSKDDGTHLLCKDRYSDPLLEARQTMVWTVCTVSSSPEVADGYFISFGDDFTTPSQTAGATPRLTNRLTDGSHQQSRVAERYSR